MRINKKQALERLMEASEALGEDLHILKYENVGLIVATYAVMLDLDDPDERAFYDAIKDMETK